jgi:hypothetical protein
MANKYIKTVTGGQNTSPALTDAFLLDDGVAYKWATLSSIIALGSLLPVGQMRNGKISPTVSANDLVLTLLTSSGGTPSVSDPVDVNISGTTRQVTAALSVTCADATNWANLGSAELATKETDLFCYLIWNTNLAPDAVDIFWSRVPYGRLYSDFSSTTTNEKYAAINATAPAATDECVCIGRFAATLSAGAGYTWTVPTYTNINLIHRPIFETRRLTWVPAVTSGAGTPTTVVKACSYSIINNRIINFCDITVSNKGSASGNMILTPPMVPIDSPGHGWEAGSTGKALACKIQTGVIYISLYDVTTCWVDTYRPIAEISGFLV